MSLAARDAAALSSVLSADYRFVPLGGGHSLPAGMSRDEQIVWLARLPGPPPNRDPESVALPRLVAYGEFVDTLAAQGLTPARGARQRITLPHVHLFAMSDSAHVSLVSASPSTFLLARGDSASVPEGMPDTDDHWYVVRWFAGAGPEPGEASPADRRPEGPRPDQGPVTTTLTIGRASAPGAWPLALSIQSGEPGSVRIDVYDIAGRRVFSGVAPGDETGTRRFELREPRLPRGVYWVRASQNASRAAAKLVVIR